MSCQVSPVGAEIVTHKTQAHDQLGLSEWLLSVQWLDRVELLWITVLAVGISEVLC